MTSFYKFSPIPVNTNTTIIRIMSSYQDLKGAKYEKIINITHCCSSCFR
jgi:predicted component of type VI protein secretion system